MTKFNNPLQEDNYLVWHVQSSFIPIKYDLQTIKVPCDFLNPLQVYNYESEILSFNLSLYYANLWCMYNSVITFTHNLIAILAAQLLYQHSLPLN